MLKTKEGKELNEDKIKAILSEISKLTKEDRDYIHKKFNDVYWEENNRFSVGADFNAELYNQL